MSKLISIVGVSGVGKTSLARALQAQADFALGLESHAERPFQALFKHDARYALANQLDYLLFRADQERNLRLDPRPALIDGGLDLDFHGFTRLFHARGWLSDTDLALLRRFYELVRGPDTSGLDTSEKSTHSTRPTPLLPPPDLIIHLTASDESIRARLAARHRINIASSEDAALLTTYLDEWLATLPPDRLLSLDVTEETEGFSGCLPLIFAKISQIPHPTPA